jgi:hypothetical protein
MRGRSWTALAGVAAGALGIIDVEGYEAVEEEEHVFVVNGVPDVDLSTFDGRIAVRGWDRSEVRVVVEKRGGEPGAARGDRDRNRAERRSRPCRGAAA